MLLPVVATVLIGVVIGFLDLLLFWYFLTGLLDGRFRQVTFTSFLSLLVGTTVASAPIGAAIIGVQLWPWYVVGEALPLIPGSGFGAIWFIIVLMRRQSGWRR